MSWVSIARAVLVRLLFAVHGLVCVWLLVNVSGRPEFWYMASSLGLLLLEMSVTLGKKGGKEWKWFCPSVFIYLLSVVPAVWFLELWELEKRIELRTRQERYNSTNVTAPESGEELSATLGSVLGMKMEIRIPLKLTSEEWIKMLEQLLLLLLIMGRWLLPKGKLTHDQLSQLLLVYIGTAADIVEFFDAFKEQQVRYERVLCMAILGIWSFSLIQFTLVLTATRARRDQSGLVLTRRAKRVLGDKTTVECCSPDVYGIIISIVLQDLPFLCLRLLLIFKYRVVSYTNLFFTSKNTIVIVLLIYRLVVVQLEKRREAAEDELVDTPHHLRLLKEHHRCGRRPPLPPDSASLTPSTCSGKSRLVQSGSSLSNGFYNTAPLGLSVSRCTTPYRDDASFGSVASLGRVTDKRFVRAAPGGGGGGGSGGGGTIVAGGGGSGYSGGLVCAGGAETGLSAVENGDPSAAAAGSCPVVIGGGPQAWNRLQSVEGTLNSPV